MKWIWETSDIEEGRFERSKKLEPVKIGPENDYCVFKGSTGIYSCTLSHCDCPDFQQKLHGSQPCKHILKFGALLGAYDVDSVTRNFEGPKARDLLSLAYGRFYLFKDPVMSNEEYDELKAQWADLLPSVEGVLNTSATNRKALERLKAANADFVDKTSAGGALYFFDEEIANELKKEGFPVQYAAQGSRSTSGRPAWYLRI